MTFSTSSFPVAGSGFLAKIPSLRFCGVAGTNTELSCIQILSALTAFKFECTPTVYVSKWIIYYGFGSVFFSYIERRLKRHCADFLSEKIDQKSALIFQNLFRKCPKLFNSGFVRSRWNLRHIIF